MSVPQAIQDAYDRARPAVQGLATIVEPTIARWAGDRNYLFRGRVKSVESTGEKLEGGRFESWSDIDDLYACLIVIPDRNHVPETLDYLEETFLVRHVRGRGITTKPPDVFRFDAPRIIATLRPQAGIDRMAGVDELLFEVQVVTAFEYAWQVATHDSIYKGDTIDWRRARLAAHLIAAAEQADSLIAAFDQAVESIPVSQDAQTTWRHTLVEFFKAEIDEGRIPETLRPESWIRFADNVLAVIKSYAARGAVQHELDELVAGVRTRGEKEDVPVSGSLFQLTIAELVGRKGIASIEGHRVVDSAELHDIYRIPSVPLSVAI
jgi:ppGpp synthetase/RelA/SpoT-type nucleotidyltranferase